MELFFKIVAGLLLMQVFHLASAQASTESPLRTIAQNWFRGRGKNVFGKIAEPTEEEKEGYLGTDTAAEAGSDYSGIASGSMAVFNGEEEDVIGQDKEGKQSADQTAVTTPGPRKMADTTVSPIKTLTGPTNLGQSNETEAFANSTETPKVPITHPKKHHHPNHPSVKNSTGPPHHSDHNYTHMTTFAPEANDTQESTTKPKQDKGLRNATESNTTIIETTPLTPEINETSTESPSTTAFPPETTATGTSPVTTTTAAAAAAPKTPEKANNTDKASASGSNSERGLASDTTNSKRRGGWAAILGTAVAVACVALVAYVILKNKHKKGFSHRKLVEEFASDPVHRLDNGAPLDLNFGGSAYYNPALQGDNIQMSHIPGRH